MSAVPQKANLTQIEDKAQDQAGIRSVGAVALPTAAIAGTGKDVTLLHWAWNSQMGLMFANGGPDSTVGSLMSQNGVNLHLVRQDDVNQMQLALIKFAQKLKDGDLQPREGANFVAIMGDGAGAFLAGVNPQLAKIGPEYQAEIIGSCGYSRGEDKFMGPIEWKNNPEKARGGLVSGFLRDGDWNIAIKWAGDNNIPVNPDERTYDPNAMNWYAANDYIDAAQKYVTNYSEDRPEVINGKRTGRKVHVTIQGVVTWTPGDVIVATEKGGLVSIVSTREYYWQMPNAIIGIKKWNSDNSSTVVSMLDAIFKGGDQVKNYPNALRKAAEISDVVYHEKNTGPEYWEKYYRGTTETDIQKYQVELGGSYANNLADNMYLFGLFPGSANILASTYQVYGNLVVQLYPKLVPSIPAPSEVINGSYVRILANKAQNTSIASAEAPRYSAAPMKDVVSKKSYAINFQTGSAELTEEARRVLEEIYNKTLVTSLTMEVHGHTDSTGSEEANLILSDKRAKAVKAYLQNKSMANFPNERIRIFPHGQNDPVATNDSEAGRYQNRRVVIVLGTIS